MPSEPSSLPPPQPNDAGGLVEKQLRRAVEQVHDFAVFSLDPQGRITSWNAGAERMFGYALAEILGRDGRVLFTPEDQAAGRPEEELAQAVETGRSEDERWHQRKDGTRFYMSGVTTSVDGEDGALLGFVKIARDLTERKRFEEALRTADRRKDEFLAILAHELRNPLASAAHAVALLKEAPASAEARAWAVDALERQIRQLSRLVDDLVDVSRITKGQIQLRTEFVDVSVVLDRAVGEVQPLLAERRHELLRRYTPGTLPVRVDPDRLEQVMTNLLTNAARYTNPGGRIELSGRRENDAVVIAVRDNGIGMAPEQIPTLFRMFVQGEHSIPGSGGGLGVGLSVARSLVELHGGTLTAHSDGPGCGSEFTVRLPVAVREPVRLSERRGEPPPVAAAAPGPVSTDERKRVLIVEDHPQVADGLRMLLGLRGYRVEVANDGLSALEIARAFRPDVVFMDIGLPGMDGHAVARRLRAEPGFDKVLLVALSGYGRDEDRQHSAAAGFDHHLVKPVDIRALEALLTQRSTALTA